MRQQIASGQWKPGERLPSYNETRAIHGVHTATMEKVYAQLETEGLIVRRRGSGTFVAEPVKAAACGTGMLGLSGRGFSFEEYSPYWAHLQGGVREAAARAGLQVLLLDPQNSRGWEKADGVLVCDWNDPRVPRKLVPGMPVVSLMTPVPGLASAYADDEGGARQATELLIELGHRRIGYLHAYADHAVVQQRLQGYRAALSAAGIQPQQKWARCMRGRYHAGQRFTTEARKNMLLWLRDGWQKLGCTALLCHNDEAATGVIDALHEAGIKVPEDVSIIGFDSTEYCDLVKPMLTSVHVPLREIGAAGVELLLQQITQENVCDLHKVLSTQVRERETTSAVRDV
jgi:DNA-binding LacI/PurR family transcriptional regulator